MKEACIILPADANLPIGEHGHDSLFYNLCDAFGGCTLTEGYGGWIAPDGKLIAEAVTIYTVAGDSTPQNDFNLQALAARYGAEANQQSVYWRDFDGEVHIDELATLQARVEIAGQYEAPKS